MNNTYTKNNMIDNTNKCMYNNDYRSLIIGYNSRISEKNNFEIFKNKDNMNHNNYRQFLQLNGIKYINDKYPLNINKC